MLKEARWHQDLLD
ncbi:hypothetical protein AVEN_69383-1, partial [Araneus ventricosus]